MSTSITMKRQPHSEKPAALTNVTDLQTQTLVIKGPSCCVSLCTLVNWQYSSNFFFKNFWNLS